MSNLSCTLETWESKFNDEYTSPGHLVRTNLQSVERPVRFSGDFDRQTCCERGPAMILIPTSKGDSSIGVRSIFSDAFASLRECKILFRIFLSASNIGVFIALLQLPSAWNLDSRLYQSTYFEQLLIFVWHSFPTALQTLYSLMIEATDDGEHRVEVLQIFATF